MEKISNPDRSIYCCKRLLKNISFYSQVLSPLGRFKHWEQNINKTDDFDNKTFTFTFESDPKNFPDAPALLQPPPGSSCQVVHLLSALQLACWMAKGGGTTSLVCDDGGALLHGELVLVDGPWKRERRKIFGEGKSFVEEKKKRRGKGSKNI